MKRANKKVDRQNHICEPDKVLRVAPDADDELRAKVVPPHALKELDDLARALEKHNQENRPARPGSGRSRKGPRGWRNVEDEEFRPKILQHVRLEDERERGRGSRARETPTGNRRNLARET